MFLQKSSYRVGNTAPRNIKTIGWQCVGLLQNHRYMMHNQIPFDYIPAFDGMNKNYCTFIISASIVLIIYSNQVVRPIFKVN